LSINYSLRRSLSESSGRLIRNWRHRIRRLHISCDRRRRSILSTWSGSIRRRRRRELYRGSGRFDGRRLRVAIGIIRWSWCTEYPGLWCCSNWDRRLNRWRLRRRRTLRLGRNGWGLRWRRKWLRLWIKSLRRCLLSLAERGRGTSRWSSSWRGCTRDRRRLLLLQRRRRSLS
jgi:hypothetical protein